MVSTLLAVLLLLVLDFKLVSALLTFSSVEAVPYLDQAQAAAPNAIPDRASGTIEEVEQALARLERLEPRPLRQEEISSLALAAEESQSVLHALEMLLVAISLRVTMGQTCSPQTAGDLSKGKSTEDRSARLVEPPVGYCGEIATGLSV